MLQANFMALCFIEPELLPIEVLHCGNRGFSTFFAPVTLTLIRWPSYTNLTKYAGCVQISFLSRGFRKLSSDRQTYRQTDSGTDTTEIIYHRTTPLRGWSKILKSLSSHLIYIFKVIAHAQRETNRHTDGQTMLKTRPASLPWLALSDLIT